jgi:hypothetical protein
LFGLTLALKFDMLCRSLYPTFITPWADQSAAHTVEPDFNLPPCYTVQPPPPGPNKAAAFSDETLFFMFYSSPRDALQEVAAQELCVTSFLSHFLVFRNAYAIASDLGLPILFW